MSKAAQGFSLRRTCSTPQAETRGERRSSEKEPFMDGNLKVGLLPTGDRGVGTVVVTRLKILSTY